MKKKEKEVVFTCMVCNGKGYSSKESLWFPVHQSACVACNGSGELSVPSRIIKAVIQMDKLMYGKKTIFTNKKRK
jgi:DnaJ-class molecular chaperone